MGVVKNLMVRVGADLSGLVSGFKQAGGATGNFKQKAAKDIAYLKSSLTEMKGAYTSFSEAAKDIDLTKSVTKQIAEATKELGTLEKTAADLENKIAFWSEIEPAGMQYQTQALKESLAAVDAQADSLYYKLQRLETIKSDAEFVGIDNLTYSSLNKLQMDIASTEDEIRRMEGAAEDAADETRNLGNSAKSAGSKVKTASGWIGGLRKNAKSSALSVSDLTRSLRRVGVVAVGVKLAGAVLGEFRSLVTGYISQNETLQAKVDELKAGFGQALAPAINVAANALSRLMPYILGVSNAIGELITNLFGSGWTTVAEGTADAAASTKAAAAAQNEYNRSLAGFDQITKLNSSNSSNAPGSTIVPVDVKLPVWLSNLPKKLAESFGEGDYKGVGEALASAVNSWIAGDSESGKSLGATIAEFIQGGIDIAVGFVKELDWDSLGDEIGENIVDMFAGIDWPSLGELVVELAKGLFTKKNPAHDVEFVAKVTSWKEKLDDKTITFRANMTSWKDFLPKKMIDFKANITSRLDKLKDNERLLDFKAKLTSWKDSLSNKWLDFKAKLAEWKDSLPKKVIDFKANITSRLDKLKDNERLLAFKAKLISWKDSLPSKMLDFKVKLQKGWSGGLAKALGIESITSKLNLKLPKLEIKWDTKKTIFGDIPLPAFNIKWNAKGAILNGAQLFGRVGNTWLGGGEAGREALLPLDRNTGWMDKIADRVASRVSSGGAGEQNLVVYLTLDGKVVTKTVIHNINAQAKSTGKNPLAAYI